MNESTHDPYAAPESSVVGEGQAAVEPEYVGFWMRVVASIIDTILIMLVTTPILFAVYGADYYESTQFLQGPLDFVVSYVFPFVAIIVFWMYRSATPGKMIIGARIVDSRTLRKPSTGQFIGRYFAYFPATLVLCIGLMAVGWDPRKQGWHDRMAKTLVVKGRSMPGVD